MAADEQSPTTRLHAVQPRAGPSTLVLAISGSIARTDIPVLCEHAHAMLTDSDADVVICDVGALVDPDVVAIDALARLQLTTRRLGRQLRLRRASRELQELLAICGVREVVPLAAELSLEAEGQPKQGEQPRGVQERVDPGDPTA